MHWRTQAACRTADPALFFPDTEEQAATCLPVAAALCAGCPVSEDCAAYAEVSNVSGIWAGRLYEDRIHWR